MEAHTSKRWYLEEKDDGEAQFYFVVEIEIFCFVLLLPHLRETHGCHGDRVG